MDFISATWDKDDGNETLSNALFGTVTAKKNVNKIKNIQRNKKSAQQIDQETKHANEFLKTFKTVQKKHQVVRFDVSADEEDANDDTSKRAKRNMKERNRKKRQKQARSQHTITKNKAEPYDSDEELFAELGSENRSKRDSLADKKGISLGKNNESMLSAQIIKKANKNNGPKKAKLKTVNIDTNKSKGEAKAKKRKATSNSPFTCTPLTNIVETKFKKKKYEMGETSSTVNKVTIDNNDTTFKEITKRKQRKGKSKEQNDDVKMKRTLANPELACIENKLNDKTNRDSLIKDSNKKKIKKKSKQLIENLIVGESGVKSERLQDPSCNSSNELKTKQLNQGSKLHVIKHDNAISVGLKLKKRRKKTVSHDNINESNIHSNYLTKFDSNSGINRKKANKFNTNKLSSILLEKNKALNPISVTGVVKTAGLNNSKTVKSLKERMMNQLNEARFRYLNEQLYTQTGHEAFKMFQSDEQAFKVYHEGFQSQVSKWPVNPLNLIIKQIKQLPTSHIIADFGCGGATLAQSVLNKVHSFDLVPLNEYVTVCDISKVPLSTKSVDVVVFCLSLMGTNLNDYISEANRVLKLGGELKIAEVESRIVDKDVFIIQIESFGFTVIKQDTSHKMFHLFYFNKVKPCIKSSVRDIQLEACIYKKR